MHATAPVTLNMQELDRLKMVQAVVETGLKPGRAAERLGLTVRQVERLVARYSMPHRPALPGDSLESRPLTATWICHAPRCCHSSTAT